MRTNKIIKKIEAFYEKLTGLSFSYIALLFFLLATSTEITAQDLMISNSALVSVKNGTYIILQGNYNNSGTLTANTASTIKFMGSSQQTITNSGSQTFGNITIDKTSNNVIINNDILINGTLTLTSGDFYLNGKTCTLGSSATLSETSGNTVKGTSGTITTTRDLNAPNNLNVAGLGTEITSSANLGSTVITRGHAAQSGGSNTGITRYFDITPTNDNNLNATLIFHYDDSELNSVTESDLELFRSTDSGSNWSEEGGTVNTTNNTVTLSGIGEFSRWTLAGTSSPLPVELTSFIDSVTTEGLLLKWETATEVNNYGFDVERQSSSLRQWVNIGFVKGAGNSNSPKQYKFLDSNPIENTRSDDTIIYRLKQIDIDGKSTYYINNIIKLDVHLLKSAFDALSIPIEFALMQNYPNPFNPSTTIKYDLPAEQNVRLEIYNILGERVKTLVNDTKKAGRYSITWNGKNDYGSRVASGVYIYTIRTKEFNRNMKMLMLK